jgi:hypothetical protein
MTALAAGTLTGTDLYALAFASIALWAICYAVACAIWPFTPCPKCDGAGHLRSPGKRAWRYCRRCRGTGARLRTGRRIYNYLTHLRHGSR